MNVEPPRLRRRREREESSRGSVELEELMTGVCCVRGDVLKPKLSSTLMIRFEVALFVAQAVGEKST